MEIRASFRNLDRLNRLETLFPGIVGDELDRAMAEAVLIGEECITEDTPVRTGRARAGWTSDVRRVPGGREGRVRSQNVPYIVVLNDGSKPHVIEARNGKALRFRVGGKVLVRKRVNHPGTKGAHMLESGSSRATPRIEAVFDRALRRVAVRIARGR